MKEQDVAGEGSQSASASSSKVREGCASEGRGKRGDDHSPSPKPTEKKETSSASHGCSQGTAPSTLESTSAESEGKRRYSHQEEFEAEVDCSAEDFVPGAGGRLLGPLYADLHSAAGSYRELPARPIKITTYWRGNLLTETVCTDDPEEIERQHVELFTMLQSLRASHQRESEKSAPAKHGSSPCPPTPPSPSQSAVSTNHAAPSSSALSPAGNGDSDCSDSRRYQRVVWTDEIIDADYRRRVWYRTDLNTWFSWLRSPSRQRPVKQKTFNAKSLGYERAKLQALTFHPESCGDAEFKKVYYIWKLKRKAALRGDCAASQGSSAALAEGAEGECVDGTSAQSPAGAVLGASDDASCPAEGAGCAASAVQSSVRASFPSKRAWPPRRRECGSAPGTCPNLPESDAGAEMQGYFQCTDSPPRALRHREQFGVLSSPPLELALFGEESGAQCMGEEDFAETEAAPSPQRTEEALDDGWRLIGASALDFGAAGSITFSTGVLTLEHLLQKEREKQLAQDCAAQLRQSPASKEEASSPPPHAASPSSSSSARQWRSQQQLAEKTESCREGIDAPTSKPAYAEASPASECAAATGRPPRTSNSCTNASRGEPAPLPAPQAASRRRAGPSASSHSHSRSAVEEAVGGVSVRGGAVQSAHSSVAAQAQSRSIQPRGAAAAQRGGGGSQGPGFLPRVQAPRRQAAAWQLPRADDDEGFAAEQQLLRPQAGRQQQQRQLSPSAAAGLRAIQRATSGVVEALQENLKRESAALARQQAAADPFQEVQRQLREHVQQQSNLNPPGVRGPSPEQQLHKIRQIELLLQQQAQRERMQRALKASGGCDEGDVWRVAANPPAQHAGSSGLDPNFLTLFCSLRDTIASSSAASASAPVRRDDRLASSAVGGKAQQDRTGLGRRNATGCAEEAAEQRQWQALLEGCRRALRQSEEASAFSGPIQQQPHQRAARLVAAEPSRQAVSRDKRGLCPGSEALSPAGKRGRC